MALSLVGHVKAEAVVGKVLRRTLSDVLAKLLDQIAKCDAVVVSDLAADVVVGVAPSVNGMATRGFAWIESDLELDDGHWWLANEHAMEY